MFNILPHFIQHFPIHQHVSHHLNTHSWFNSIKYCPINIDIHKSTSNIDSNVIKCKKIFIHPNQKQRKKILRWFHICDYYYNKSVDVLNSDKTISSHIKLRNKVKHMDNFSKKYGRKRIILADSIIHTFREAFTNLTTGYIKIKLGQIKRFRLKKRKNSRNIKTIFISEKGFSSKYNTIFKSCLGPHLNTSESIKNIKTTCRFQYNKKTNKFMLFVPIEENINMTLEKEEFCSLDPGMRTFQTLYSKTNCYDIGTNVTPKIRSILNKIENKKKYKDEKWYKKYSNRLYQKITNLIDDLHWKTSKFLVTNYNNIIVGNMSSSNIVKNTKNLPKKLRPIMNLLKHYQFRERLKFKAEQYGSHVVEQDESYTSKTCGGCGKLNQKLGAKKQFKCECGFELDRDLNGARNIMIKCIGK